MAQLALLFGRVLGSQACVGIRVKGCVAVFEGFEVAVILEVEERFQNTKELSKFIRFSWRPSGRFAAHGHYICFAKGNESAAVGIICHRIIQSLNQMKPHLIYLQG